MPHTRVRVERDDSAHATAANLFNRIPDIIAAPPGIQPVYRLGPLKTTAVI
jgi:4-hydroxy-tetrahydrodipicolinate reductase